MNPPHEDSNNGALPPEDLAVLEALQSGSLWLRAILSTLARRGVAFRRQDEKRAQRILEELAPSPLYKGGQFLFDLLELEDFMVDGTPAETIPTTLDATTLVRLANLLNDVKRHLDGAVEPLTPEGLDIQLRVDAIAPEQLPALEAGFYLYQDVVLGLVHSLGPHLTANHTPGTGATR